MTLSGSLEAFPLDEVLRLLARAGKSGCLRVETDGMQGKIFVRDGYLAYATTRSDEELRAQILNAGLVNEDSWREVENRGKSIPDALTSGKGIDDLRSFIMEHITDVLFRLRRPGHGTFDFANDVMPRYDTGQALEVEVAVSESKRRLSQWREIEEVIPAMTFRLKMASALPGDREVTISPDTWRMLAALDGQGTVSELAHKLGSSDFLVGQAMASLIRAGLVDLIDKVVGARYGYGQPTEEPSETAGYRTAPILLMEEPESADHAADSDDRFLQDVFTQLHHGDANAAESDEESEAEAPEEEPEEAPEPNLGMLRRRGLGAMAKGLTDRNG